MSREIYALFISLNMVLTVQLKNDNKILATSKETFTVTVENDLEELSIFHKIIRIVCIVMVTLIGITAAIMFTRNVLDYQRAQKRFIPKKSYSPEWTNEKNDENEQKKEQPTAIVPIDSISEHSTKLEPKSTDFPTVIPSRNSAGQDDDDYNKTSPPPKRRPGWDDVEMMRHGLFNTYCVRAALSESTAPPTTINIGSTYSHKMTTSKQTDRTSAISESVQNLHSDYSEDFHKSV